jgi:hypothetical protein
MSCDRRGIPMPADLDLMVLHHLRGYPDELRRFSNLMKQSHGRAAAEYFLDRPVPGDSFIAAVSRLVMAGEDIVTVVEAAELLGVPPAALLTPEHQHDLPEPLTGAGRYRLWRRADVLAHRGASAGESQG